MQHSVGQSVLVIVLLIVLLIALPIMGNRLWPEVRGSAEALARELRDAALRWMPVYSAETTRGKEAEFIRDRLPSRFPIALVAAALVLFLAVHWWLNR